MVHPSVHMPYMRCRKLSTTQLAHTQPWTSSWHRNKATQPTHSDHCLLFRPFRHATIVVAGQQVDGVEPSLRQACQVRQAGAVLCLALGSNVLRAERAVLATQVWGHAGVACADDDAWAVGWWVQ